MSLIFHDFELQNFKAYVGAHKVVLDNRPGLYYIRGINNAAPELESNGAAKSTLFDALIWVLYGKTLRDERPGDSIEPWSGEKPTTVTLRLSRHGVKHLLVRGRKPNILTLQCLASGGRLGSPPKECAQEEIDALIGLSYSAALCTIVLPQFGVRFLDMRPEEQARLFSETLNLDLWLKASEDAGKLAKVASADLADAEREMAVLSGSAATLADMIARERAAKASFVATQREHSRKLAQELADAETALAALRKRKPAPNTPTDADLDAVSDAVTTLKKELAALVAEIAEAATLANQTANEEARSRHSLALLASQPDVCPMCGTKVARGHFAKEKKLLTDSIAEYTEIVVSLADEGLRLERKRTYLQSRIATREDALVVGMKQIRDEQLRQRDHAAEDKALADKLGRLWLETKVSAKQANPHDANLAALQSAVAEVKVQQEVLQAKAEEAEWSKKAYEYWAESYRQIRLDLIDDVLRGLEHTANQEAEALGLIGWRIEFVTERETVAGKISRGFTTMLYPPGETEPIRWESFCGGEVQRWQLATRFALSDLLLANAGVTTNIEILDEPSAHLSPGGVDMLLDCLRARADRLGRQVWLVEHHVFPDAAFAGVLTVTHDAEGSHAVFG